MCHGWKRQSDFESQCTVVVWKRGRYWTVDYTDTQSLSTLIKFWLVGSVKTFKTIYSIYRGVILFIIIGND